MEGDSHQAARLLIDSEMADPDSLLVKLYVAEFLGARLGDREAAVKKCEEVIEIAMRAPFAESDDDFSSEAYVQKAETFGRL